MVDNLNIKNIHKNKMERIYEVSFWTLFSCFIIICCIFTWLIICNNHSNRMNRMLIDELNVRYYRKCLLYLYEILRKDKQVLSIEKSCQTFEKEKVKQLTNAILHFSRSKDVVESLLNHDKGNEVNLFLYPDVLLLRAKSNFYSDLYKDIHVLLQKDVNVNNIKNPKSELESLLQKTHAIEYSLS